MSATKITITTNDGTVTVSATDAGVTDAEYAAYSALIKQTHTSSMYGRVTRWDGIDRAAAHRAIAKADYYARATGRP
jgi:hypothetical protein